MTDNIQPDGCNRLEVYHDCRSIHAAREPFGYAKLIGIKASDRLELSEKIQAGFPFNSFVILARSMEVTNKELAELVQISTRTLNRREKEGKLKADESDRLLRFARIFTLRNRFV